MNHNLHLPQFTFNQRANGAQREPELNAFWETEDVFTKRNADNTGEKFTLHDGPPYCNGNEVVVKGKNGEPDKVVRTSVHMGHVLNKTLKDVINKYNLMRGRKVTFVPGWDCHGLPTELQVTKKQRYADVGELRDACGEHASTYLNHQRDVFKRLGFMGRWDKPYVTMNPEYEVAELRVFAEMFFKGLVYRDKKPVHFSPSTQTVLAEAELEYVDRVDRAAYVAFPMKSASLVVWTTMPWTLLGNKAVAVHPSLSYAYVRSGTTEYVVAENLVAKLAAEWGCELSVLRVCKGTELAGLTYTNPLTATTHPVVADLFVSDSSGTGLVHLCPAHGLEDFMVCKKHQLEPVMVANFKGKLDDSFGELAGLPVLEEGSAAVLDKLGDAVVYQHPYKHSYPHDWRTKKPVLFMLTEQFFVNVEALKEDAVAALNGVEMANPVHRNRLMAMVNNRKDWCVSRQRKWGLPIPVFVHSNGDLLLNHETLEHLLALVKVQGSNAWFNLSVSELLPAAYQAAAHEYTKVTDTLDVWFDSGSSWAAVLQQEDALSDVADVYLEGSDQHRGWFQSSLLTSVAVRGCAPYKRVVTHGFVLDEHGKKMSKSLGNVVDPMVLLKDYNADVMRLWCMSVDYTEDMLLGQTVMKQMVDAYFRLRNSFRFLLGNVFDYEPNQANPLALSTKDETMLTDLKQYKEAMLGAYDTYNFREVFNLTMNFFTHMSKFYFDLDNKSVLYESVADDVNRRNCQYVMTCLLNVLTPLLTPVVSYLCEDVHQNRLDKPTVSVFYLPL